MSKWNQPVCTQCWVDENSHVDPDDPTALMIRQPVRLKDQSFEELLKQCCKCGTATTSGIWIRVDPDEVSFPRLTDD